MDRPIRWKHETTRCASASWLPFFSEVGQILRQFITLAIWTVNVVIDRLVADAQSLSIKLKPTSDLFRRPTFHELRDDRSAQFNKQYKFASPRTTVDGKPLRGHTMITIQG
tara:strand:+ start:1806 stop:2138 length:333 start_codon:yes stop_codon:yes gene_type:complete